MFTIDEDTNMITIIKKDTASFDVALENHDLVDGDTVTFTVATELEQEEPILQKKVTEFQEGIAQIFLSSEDTDLETGTYFYDIQIDTADGLVDTVVGPAKFKIIGGVTY